jgi:hypothetical protein
MATRLRFLLSLSLWLAVPVLTSAQTPVRFDIETGTGTDTLFVGVPAKIIFNLDANGNTPWGLTFKMEFVYSGPNLLGVLQPASIVFTPASAEIFELGPSANLDHWDGTGTDSLWVEMIDGGGDHWVDSGEVWHVSTIPTAAGSFHFDSITFPVGFGGWGVAGDNGQPLPFEIINYGREYTVLWLNGDVNSNGVINSADIIYEINFVFKSGPAPMFCEGLGDVDCSTDVSSSDIIFLVNYAFKGGPAPCDITPLIPGTWPCP